MALPAQRIDAAGRARVDTRAVAALALPLMLNSSLQAIVSLTDTWFVGHISTAAIAGMGAVIWCAHAASHTAGPSGPRASASATIR